MSELVRYQPDAETQNDPQALRPVEPKLPGVEVRLATQADFAWIDVIQKSESDGLGFQFEQALRKRIEQGNILAAEVVDPQTGQAEPAGYCLGVDRYQKRGDLGIIYQIGVVQKFRRRLVAATLLQAQFDKSAYGTRLYCCWCKQSLAANRFWEAMGFVPLAFRAGGRPRKSKASQERAKVHIFWQKRVRVGDTGDPAEGGTPWWYPYETQGGAMMEGRVVLPLPPEVQWHEATPVVLPGAERRAAETGLLEDLLGEVEKRERAAKKGLKGGHAKTQGGRDAKGNPIHAPGLIPGAGAGTSRAVAVGGFGVGSGFGEPPAPAGSKGGDVSADDRALLTQDEAEVARLEAEKAAAKKALKAAQRKNDPELVAYARELRDRWQEHVAPGSELAKKIESKQRGRYAVGRLLDECTEDGAERTRVVEIENEKSKQLPRAA